MSLVVSTSPSLTCREYSRNDRIENETRNKFTSVEYIASLQQEFSTHYVRPLRNDPDSYGRKLEKLDEETRKRYLAQTSLSQTASGEFKF